MPDGSLFHGIAVVIDDEIHDAKATVGPIKKSIEDAGCHVVPLSALPSDSSIVNLREVAFFVLDWKLNGAALKEFAGVDGVQVPTTLVDENAASIVHFLKELKKVRVAPVFIFTDEEVDVVTTKLKEHADLYDETDPSHIRVISKADVSKLGLFNVLADWMKSAPSVYVLKKWERAYEKAKNEMFMDFYVKSPRWPLIVWKNFKDDSVSPPALLGRLIGRNLVSRMAVFDCNLELFPEMMKAVTEDADADGPAVRKVFEGERFLAEERLDKLAFEPGDIFLNADGSYLINVRPDCDCIPRGHDKLDSLDLYLLSGKDRTSDLKYDPVNGVIQEQDNEAIVFPIHEGKAIGFKFKKLHLKKWKELKLLRKGRIIPPALTRLQERYAAYLQRPGLARVPVAAFPPQTATPLEPQAKIEPPKEEKPPADSAKQDIKAINTK